MKQKENLTYSYLFEIDNGEYFVVHGVSSFDEAFEQACFNFDYETASSADVYELGPKHKVVTSKPTLKRV